MPFVAPARPHVNLALNIEHTNEDLTITLLTPPIAKIHYILLAWALNQYLLDEGVQVPEIQPFPIRDAYVSFTKPLERECFLQGTPRQFSQYHLRFIKHDEGENFISHGMDRVVLLMLMCYPTDGWFLSLISKSIYNFAQLLYVHESVTVARIIVKALVNKEQDTPDDIVVSAGEGPCICSFTVPIFILSPTDVVVGADEQPPPNDGPAHPMPHPAACWMHVNADVDSKGSNVEVGDIGVAPDDPMENDAAVGDTVVGDDHHEDRIQQPLEKLDGELVRVVLGDHVSCLSPTAKDFESSVGLVRKPPMDGPQMPSPDVLVGEATATALVPMRSILDLVIDLSSLFPCNPPFNSFANVNRLVINLDTPVPSHFANTDTLWHLAKVLVDPLEPAALVSSDDDEVKILDEMPVRKTPRKHRANKPKCPQDS